MMYAYRRGTDSSSCGCWAMGGFIHTLLVIAVIVIVLRVIQRRKVI
jgi:hypothetical protein